MTTTHHAGCALREHTGDTCTCGQPGAEGVTKTLDENFTDWENEAFGFGYGTGEAHTTLALKTFFASIPPDGGDSRLYDYRNLEAALTPAVAWLLLNVMGHQDIIEYGSSPRFGWLTPQGYALKAFVDSKTADELYDLTVRDENYSGCSRDACNCRPRGYQAGVKCVNPFWWNK